MLAQQHQLRSPPEHSQLRSFGPNKTREQTRFVKPFQISWTKWGGKAKLLRARPQRVRQKICAPQKFFLSRGA
jgi:hypothetical protein